MFDSVIVEIIGQILTVLLLGIIYLVLRAIGWRAILWPKQTVRGWLAEDANYPITANPYKPGTPEWKAWRAGWDASRETNP